MKKGLKKLFKIIGIAILVIFLALLIIPVVFKDQIKEKVLAVANEKVNAELSIDDFSLTLLRNFPNLTFRLKGVTIVGIDEFRGDTLAGLRSFNLVFDLASIIGKSGYIINAIEIDRPVAYVIILEDGTANYDIVPETVADATEIIKDEAGEDGSSHKGESKLSLNLKKFEITDAYISYNDMSSGMKAIMRDLDLVLSGNMAKTRTDLLLEASINGIDFIMGDMKYLNDANISASFNIGADLKNMVFTLRDNRVAINALQLMFSGTIAITGEDINTDLRIETGDTEFKSVLSMIPAVYMNDFDGLSTKGSFSISGDIKGRYSAADSVLPDVSLALEVSNGFISYPDLPENISNINIETTVFVDGSNPDNTIVDLKKFHFELAGNPFDMSLLLKTPLSDPEVEADFRGKLNLEALSQAVPMELSEFKGIIDISLHLGGRMSMIENEDFDKFDARGNINLSGFKVEMEGVPPVGIEKARFGFTPQYAALEELKLDIAGNKVNIEGRLENYLPFIFDDKTVFGRMSLYSPNIDLDTIVSYFPTETSAEVKQDDTISISVISLPENIDFEFNSHIEKFSFDPLEATNLEGNFILRDGVLIIENTGLETLGGKMIIDAEYDSRDTLNPSVQASLSVSDLGIKPAFAAFNTIRKLAPIAEGMEGDISVEFSFSGLLGEGMMPVLETINGKGRLISEEIKLVSSPVYNNLSKVLSLGENFSNSFKDVDVEFSVRDGRVYIAPFDTKLGDMKVNISGDHGLDQTINYLMKTEIPTDRLPGAMKTMISGLAAQAALFGIKYEPPEIIRMNISVGGTVKDPVIKPALAQGEGKATVKEVASEAVKEVVKEKVEEVKEMVSDQAQKQADRILAEAEKQSQVIRNEAAKAAQRIRDEASINGQKLIDGAASKGALAKIAANKGAEVLIREAGKKADDLELEADKKAEQILEVARRKADELLGKI